MFEIYKRNSIELTQNGNGFDIKINGRFIGNTKNTEHGFKYGRYYIDDAISRLCNIEGDTVIDEVYKDSIDFNTFEALKILTGYSDYIPMLAKYEGYSISEMIDLNK